MSTTDRTKWIRRALWLAALTMAFNLLEGLVSLWFGWEDRSLALCGFGLDSLVEVASAALIFWRFWREVDEASRPAPDRERLATRGIGLMLLILAGSTALGAGVQLTRHQHPMSTLAGVIVSSVSLLVMFAFWRSKLMVAAALDSRAMKSDAACSLACMQLSSVVLIGGLLFQLSRRLWWVDGVTALMISGLIAWEGWAGFRASLKPDFSGGCGCGHD